MSTAAARRHAVIWAVSLLVAMAIALSFGNFRALLVEAARSVSLLAVFATLPGQIASSLLCAAGLWVFRPGVGYAASTASRLLRDAGDNLLVFLPGIGEIIGARAIVLAGGKTRPAIAASALDKVAEFFAQIPYMAFAGWVFWHGWQNESLQPGDLIWLPVLAIGAIAAAIVVVKKGADWGPIRRFRAEWDKTAEEVRIRKRAMPLSTALHFVAWLMGGVQIWMAARALHFDISLFDAIAIESVVYAGRTVLLMVPAGIGTQEAVLVAAGLIFGLTAPQSLALGLVLRLRDLVFGVPLIAWPLFELRSHRRKMAREASLPKA
ncbi:MAG: lysylphosphatidylglycerol synthase domain-containing protein [Novosphingobium sp.]